MAIEYMIPLYLLVTANFLGDTLGKDAQRVMRNNPVAKHAVILLAILFAFVLSDPNYSDKHMDMVLVQVAIVYALFLMSVRLPFEVLALVILVLAATYLVHRQMKLLQRENRPYEALESFKSFLGNTAIGIIVVGFAASIIE